jgi:hypothetical protein
MGPIETVATWTAFVALRCLSCQALFGGRDGLAPASSDRAAASWHQVATPWRRA